jgi:activator of HSP90 ATPase
MVRAYTRSDVQMNVEKGGRFALFGGNITGEYVKLVCIANLHYSISNSSFLSGVQQANSDELAIQVMAR